MIGTWIEIALASAGSQPVDILGRHILALWKSSCSLRAARGKWPQANSQLVNVNPVGRFKPFDYKNFLGLRKQILWLKQIKILNAKESKKHIINRSYIFIRG